MNPPAMRGMVVFGFWLLSARSATWRRETGMERWFPADLLALVLGRGALDPGHHRLGFRREEWLGRRVPRRNHLRRHHGLGGTPLVQIFLHAPSRPRLLPVFPSVPKRDRKCETSRRPKLQSGKGESGGKIERHRQDAGADNVGARQVEVVDESIGGDAAEQAFEGNGVQPLRVTRQQPEQRRNEHDEPQPAQKFGHRRNDLAGTEPAHSESTQEKRKQKRSHAEALQQQIGSQSSDDANPVARLPRTREHRGAVERRIERRIRSQRKKKEERGNTQQEPNQLIEPPVVGGSENPGEILHGRIFGASKNEEPSPLRSRLTTPEPNDYGKNWLRPQRPAQAGQYRTSFPLAPPSGRRPGAGAEARFRSACEMLRPRPGQEYQHQASHDHAVDGKRHKPVLPYPGHEPGHRPVRHDE